MPADKHSDAARPSATAGRDALRKKLARWVAPPAAVSARDWIPAHVVIPPSISPVPGPYSIADFPHLTADGGPIAAFDDPVVEELSLMWATQVSKTICDLCLCTYTVALQLGSWLFVLPNRDKARQISDRLTAILEATPATRKLLPPEHLREQFALRLGGVTCYFAWSGSPTAVGDLSVPYLVLAELDKHATQKSVEDEPAELALSRVKAYEGSSKVIRESTPTLDGSSRVHRAFVQSDQRRYHVPCPHCGEIQPLETGQVQWDESRAGDQSVAARKTAKYHCRGCSRAWTELERKLALRAGEWIAAETDATQSTTPRGAQEFIHHRAGFQLGSLYSTRTSVGRYAEKYVQSRGRSEQDFANSWEGLPWTPHQTRFTWQQLGERLATAAKLGVVPAAVAFLTGAIDVQLDTFPWIVCGFALIEKQPTAWLIDYGIAASLEEAECEILGRQFADAEDKRKLWVALTCIDAGYRKEEVYRWGRAHRNRVRVVKGAHHLASGKPFSAVSLDSKGRVTKRTARDFLLWHVNHDHYQEVIAARLETHAGEPGALNLPEEAAGDGMYLQQLTNEARVKRTDPRGYEAWVWESLGAHDFRDCHRYCEAAAAMVSNNWRPVTRTAQQTRPPMTTPDGRPWFILDR